jgi:hypothetical protein
LSCFLNRAESTAALCPPALCIEEKRREYTNQMGSEFVINSTTVNSQEVSSATALADGRFVVTWQDNSESDGDTSGPAIRAQILNADGSKSGNEFLVNTTTEGLQSNPTIAALQGGGFAIAWFDNTTHDVRAQIYDADSNPRGNEFLVNTATPGGVIIPDPTIVGLVGGGFVISWSELDVKAQVFDAEANAVGTAFTVNETLASGQTSPSIAALTNGGFVISWYDPSGSAGDVDSGAIHAQVFNGNGGESGDEFLVNTTTAGIQYAPVSTSLADGRFIVSWTDESATGGDTAGAAIRAQIFNADGTKSGAELLVNTTTAAFQNDQSITALSDGRFVVTWTDFSQTGGDTSATAIRAQLFNTDGSKSGDEFIVNANTAGAQAQPTITALADGRILFAFYDGSDVHGQIFDPRDEAVTLFGGVVEDQLVGTYLNDTIEGRDGNDELWGENGQDTLLGEGGNDELHGGLGNDLIDGGDGNDDLRGDAGSDKLIGGGGNDLMIGGSGADEMVGGTGDDFYSLDSLSDIVTEKAGEGADTISTQFFGIDLANYANVENVFLAGTGDFNLAGSSANNQLLGNEGDNVITGKGGADDMFGSDGADTFAFTALKDSTTKAAGRDTIEDFTLDADKIDLSAIDAKKGGADNAFTFIGTAKFHHHKGELHFKIKGADALVEGDVNGDGKADFAILLKHVTSLAATDFDL